MESLYKQIRKETPYGKFKELDRSRSLARVAYESALGKTDQGSVIYGIALRHLSRVEELCVPKHLVLQYTFDTMGIHIQDAKLQVEHYLNKLEELIEQTKMKI